VEHFGIGDGVGGTVGSAVGKSSAVGSLGICSLVVGMGVSKSITGWKGVNVIVVVKEPVDRGGFVFVGG
jgi:hypothetical protein